GQKTLVRHILVDRGTPRSTRPGGSERGPPRRRAFLSDPPRSGGPQDVEPALDDPRAIAVRLRTCRTPKAGSSTTPPPTWCEHPTGPCRGPIRQFATTCPRSP